MCESTAIQCQQCDKHKTSCRGQVGTFDPGLCPDIPCAKCAECELGCKQSQFRAEECKKDNLCYCNGGYVMGIDLAKGADYTVRGRKIEDGAPKRKVLEEMRELIEKYMIRFPVLSPSLVDELRNMKPLGVTLSTREEVFAVTCKLDMYYTVDCEPDCPFLVDGCCDTQRRNETIESVLKRCIEFLKS